MSMDGMERVRVTSADLCACQECCHTTLSIAMEDRDCGHLNALNVPTSCLIFVENHGWMQEMTHSLLLSWDLTHRTYSSFDLHLQNSLPLAAQYLYFQPSPFLLSLLMIFVVNEDPPLRRSPLADFAINSSNHPAIYRPLGFSALPPQILP